MSYPSDPRNPYGQQPQQPYGHPQQPPFPQQQGYPGYPQGGPVPGMPPFAGWGARAGATLIDFLIAGLLPLILIGVGYARFISAVVDASGNCTDLNCPTPDFPGSTFVLITIGGLLNLIGNLWLCYREGSTGQTPGKKALGIRVLREVDGQPLGFGMACIRRLCHGLDAAACYIGYLWPLWDEKSQTFSDKIMNTVVVKPQ